MSSSPDLVPPPPPPPADASPPKKSTKKRGPYKKKKKGPPEPEQLEPELTEEQAANLAAMEEQAAVMLGALAGLGCEVLAKRRPREQDCYLVGKAGLGALAAWFPHMDEKERSLVLLVAAVGGMVKHATPIQLAEPGPGPEA